MFDFDRTASSVGLPADAVGSRAEFPGAPRDPFPGDTHWYDLPDDDAAPEADEEEDEAGARWRPRRLPWRR